MNETTSDGLVVPPERGVNPVKRKVGRKNKVEAVLKLGGDKMVQDLAGRKQGIKSSAGRVADWGNSNGLKICDATGRRAVLKLIADGRLVIKEETRNYCLWKVVALPD